ncbi:MAG: signal peptidase I [Armatimonadetes bacterium]|nr:signal peptidase I [Armatimonadota bacterium]
MSTPRTEYQSLFELHGKAGLKMAGASRSSGLQDRRRSRERGHIHLISLGAVLILSALSLRASPFRLGVVVGESMTPTLSPHKVFMLDRSFYEHATPTRGEIVVAEANGETCVKRVAAGPREDLWLLEYKGELSGYSEVVRPHDLTRTRSLVERYPRIGQLRRVTVPEGRVFLVGDAQNLSWDSRNYGTVPVSSIMGRVFPLTAKASRSLGAAPWRT